MIKPISFLPSFAAVPLRVGRGFWTEGVGARHEGKKESLSLEGDRERERERPQKATADGRQKGKLNDGGREDDIFEERRMAASNLLASHSFFLSHSNGREIKAQKEERSIEREARTDSIYFGRTDDADTDER